jgi:hypothetical protein
MQAAIASLFDCELQEVPNFIEYKEGWFSPLWEFIKPRGYEYNGTLYWNAELEKFGLEKIKYSEGVNGYFYASVCSPGFNPEGDHRGTTHAVIINKNLEVVWDPNPKYMALHESHGDKFSYPGGHRKYQGILYVHLIEKLPSKCFKIAV